MREYEKVRNQTRLKYCYKDITPTKSQTPKLTYIQNYKCKISRVYNFNFCKAIVQIHS